MDEGLDVGMMNGEMVAKGQQAHKAQNDNVAEKQHYRGEQS